MYGSARKRITELNPHLLCVLCGGYLIDATTITECLHAFCKSCIVRYLETHRYCPICDVLVHKTKPLQNIRPDHILRKLVYKIVPELYSKEMRDRRIFYSQVHPNLRPVNCEDRGELTDESHFFTSDETVHIALEYVNNVGNQLFLDSTDKRYFRCPAAVTIGTLQKLISSKYGIGSDQSVVMFCDCVPLCPSLTLMDVAYISCWKRKNAISLMYQILKSDQMVSLAKEQAKEESLRSSKPSDYFFSSVLTSPSLVSSPYDYSLNVTEPNNNLINMKDVNSSASNMQIMFGISRPSAIGQRPRMNDASKVTDIFHNKCITATSVTMGHHPKLNDTSKVTDIFHNKCITATSVNNTLYSGTPLSNISRTPFTGNITATSVTGTVYTRTSLINTSNRCLPVTSVSNSFIPSGSYINTPVINSVNNVVHNYGKNCVNTKSSKLKNNASHIANSTSHNADTVSYTNITITGISPIHGATFVTSTSNTVTSCNSNEACVCTSIDVPVTSSCSVVVTANTSEVSSVAINGDMVIAGNSNSCTTNITTTSINVSSCGKPVLSVSESPEESPDSSTTSVSSVRTASAVIVTESTSSMTDTAKNYSPAQSQLTVRSDLCIPAKHSMEQRLSVKRQKLSPSRCDARKINSSLNIDSLIQQNFSKDSENFSKRENGSRISSPVSLKISPQAVKTLETTQIQKIGCSILKRATQNNKLDKINSSVTRKQPPLLKIDPKTLCPIVSSSSASQTPSSPGKLIPKRSLNSIYSSAALLSKSSSDTLNNRRYPGINPLINPFLYGMYSPFAIPHCGMPSISSLEYMKAMSNLHANAAFHSSLPPVINSLFNPIQTLNKPAEKYQNKLPKSEAPRPDNSPQNTETYTKMLHSEQENVKSIIADVSENEHTSAGTGKSEKHSSTRTRKTEECSAGTGKKCLESSSFALENILSVDPKNVKETVRDNKEVAEEHATTEDKVSETLGVKIRDNKEIAEEHATTEDKVFGTLGVKNLEESTTSNKLDNTKISGTEDTKTKNDNSNEEEITVTDTKTDSAM